MGNTLDPKKDSLSQKEDTKESAENYAHIFEKSIDPSVNQLLLCNIQKIMFFINNRVFNRN